jgi:hypothetical protein
MRFALKRFAHLTVESTFKSNDLTNLLHRRENLTRLDNYYRAINF